MAGMRREEAKRTQAMEEAAAIQNEILKELSAINRRLAAIEKILNSTQEQPTKPGKK